jgi:ABC-type Mn2+/Zn2+ transport system ATPase subunit
LRAAFIHRDKDRPQVMILDEPFSGVDERHIHDTAAWLSSISEALGLQIIMVNHEWPDVWAEHADNIIDLSVESSL